MGCASLRWSRASRTSAPSSQSVIPAKAGSALLRRSRTSRDFSAIFPVRHSRESGLCFTSAEPNIQRLQRHLSGSSFPRKRALLYFGGAEHPETSAPSFRFVIPAKAGSALLRRSRTSRDFSAILPVRHSRERGNPVPFVRERLKSLYFRVRGNDERKTSETRHGTEQALTRTPAVSMPSGTCDVALQLRSQPIS
jgi:hypothetical protein